MTLTNLEVAQATQLRPLSAIAEVLGLPAGAVLPWGPHAAKLDPSLSAGRGRGKMVLVTAMNPTPAGEGKTTTVVGLTQGLVKQGESACAVLREPSLGPVFGIKGGGCGGGRSQVLPMEDINLHFTGDLHAVSAAHNLLAAMVDNHLHHGNALGLEDREILWPRVMDMNDRALREVMVGLGGRTGGVPRQARFDITAASEVMAILALARDLADLRERLGRIVVGFTRGKTPKPVTAGQLKANGSMALLLKHALKPNLAQTVEGAPALVHTGPFGNIAHGCPSVQAIDISMRHAAYTVVEAGFGADLGAQKFLDIVCPITGDWPDAVVLVGTVRACKVHAGIPMAKVAEPNPEAVTRGLENVLAHVEAMRRRGLEPVVSLNQRSGDPAVDE
jgi:formate--tetrahydrofolate ligase